MAEHPFLTERKDFFSCLDRRDGQVDGRWPLTARRVGSKGREFKSRP